MKIREVLITPLLVPYAQPYYWSQGVTLGAEAVSYTHLTLPTILRV